MRPLFPRRFETSAVKIEIFLCSAIDLSQCLSHMGDAIIKCCSGSLSSLVLKVQLWVLSGKASIQWPLVRCDRLYILLSATSVPSCLLPSVSGCSFFSSSGDTVPVKLSADWKHSCPAKSDVNVIHNQHWGFDVQKKESITKRLEGVFWKMQLCSLHTKLGVWMKTVLGDKVQSSGRLCFEWRDGNDETFISMRHFGSSV